MAFPHFLKTPFFLLFSDVLRMFTRVSSLNDELNILSGDRYKYMGNESEYLLFLFNYILFVSSGIVEGTRGYKARIHYEF